MRLIDADRAIEIVRSRGIAHPNAYHLTNYATLILQEAPTVDAVPVRHGHWIMNEDDELYCSVCGYIASLDSNEYFYRGKIRFDDSFYCPNCGAKMDEEVSK